MIKNKILFASKYLILIAFFLFFIPQYAHAGLSEKCFPGVYCLGTDDYYAKKCRTHIETIADCGTPPANKFYGFSCENGCYLRTKAQPAVCPGGVQIAGNCYTIMNVIDHITNVSLFKIWDGTLLHRLVYLPDVDCTDTYVPAWNNATKTWYCAEGGLWTRNATTPSKIHYSGGNVGINTSDPNYTLDVNGDTNISGDLNVGGTTTTKNLNVTNTANISNLTVTNSATFEGDTTFNKNITVLGDKSGVNAKYASFTGSYNGGRGGYKSADNLCGGSGKHICTADDIVNTYVQSAGVPNSGLFWINNGPPGYVKYVTNDCDGWNTNSNNMFGSVWDFSSKSSFVTPCNQVIPFACCK